MEETETRDREEDAQKQRKERQKKESMREETTDSAGDGVAGKQSIQIQTEVTQK